jgi:hypothetical protein
VGVWRSSILESVGELAPFAVVEDGRSMVGEGKISPPIDH